MTLEMFTPDTLTIDSLREVFDAAMMDVETDSDGDLVIRDKYRVIVSVHGTDKVRFLCVFGVKDSADEADGHALCNRINDELIIVRASMHGPTTMLVDWYLPTRGGLGRKTVVLALRQFVEIVSAIGKYDADDLID